MWADYFDDRALILQALRKSYVDLHGTDIGTLWSTWKTRAPHQSSRRY